MRTIDEKELGDRVRQLLDEVTRTGGELAVTRDGEVIAQLAPKGFRAKSLIGLHKGQVTIRGDINNVVGDSTDSDEAPQ